MTPKRTFGLTPYPGGKTRSVPDLLNRIGPLPDDFVFVEPFLGGGVVALNMLALGLASRVRLNDRDEGVAALWTATIQQPGMLIDRVLNFPGTDHTAVKAMFDARRSGTLTGFELGFAELVVRQTTYRAAGCRAGSPCRATLHRQWKPGRFCDRIVETHAILQGRVVGNHCTSDDALDVIAEGGDRYLFLDPPYVSQGPHAYMHRFDVADHQRLSRLLWATSHPWLLCYDDNPAVRQLYSGFAIDRTHVQQTSKSQPGVCGEVLRAELRIQAEPA